MHRRSIDTNLVEITHEEMSGLLDSQINAQNESLFQYLHKFQQALEMCAKEHKKERKNDDQVLMKTRTLKGCSYIRRTMGQSLILMNFGLLILQRMKVLILQ